MNGKKQGPSCPLCGAPYSLQRNHYGLRDVARFYPLNGTTHIVWDHSQHFWACEECGESWGGEYDDPCCQPYGWNFCSNCGREICRIFEGKRDAEQDGRDIELRDAHVVRRWDNGLGIGGLADPAHKDDYTLDKLGTARVYDEKVVAVIPLGW